MGFKFCCASDGSGLDSKGSRVSIAGRDGTTLTHAQQGPHGVGMRPKIQRNDLPYVVSKGNLCYIVKKGLRFA